MKWLSFIVVAALVATMTAGPAAAQKKSKLDKDPDLFAVVTPDRLLGKMTRREWLTLWPVPGREYWAAWDCQHRSCDTDKRKHIRETARLIPRTAADPEPLTDADASSPHR